MPAACSRQGEEKAGTTDGKEKAGITDGDVFWLQETAVGSKEGKKGRMTRVHRARTPLESEQGLPELIIEEVVKFSKLRVIHGTQLLYFAPVS